MAEMKEKGMKTGHELLNYITKAVSPYHAVKEGCNLLRQAGFQELDIQATWELQRGGAYFVRPFATTLFSFTVGQELTKQNGFHIAAAHTDHPCLHIKPDAELPKKPYERVNVEIYGGPILNTWLDRPLSAAGRIALRSDSIYEPRMILIDLGRPLFTIPNLPIHINREINRGIELKRQIDMIPIFGIDSGQEHYFLDFLASEIGVKPEEILDFDLYIYNKEQGCILGRQEEFISSPRLDNLTSCYALLKAIMTGRRQDGINLIALYDNEEVGSLTKQGANSALLNIIIEKLVASFGIDKERLNDAIFRSFLLSVDVAHALHPNHPEKYDPVNVSGMNEGVVLKINCNQKYSFDTEAIAAICQLCESADIQYKKFVNHSDIAGGGTIGSMISSWLPMKTVDLGVPLLAMHSARELMGIQDQVYLEQLLTAFFSK